MRKTIWFDMDGTLYDLYKIPGWLEMLESGHWSQAFNSPGRARAHIDRINAAIEALWANGWTVGVITWAPKGVEDSRALERIGNIKLGWLMENVPALGCNELAPFLCVRYGEDKAGVLHRSGFRGDINYLVDDNKEVRKSWRKWDSDYEFRTINASRSYVRELEGLVM